jgi:hypothetical protein
MKPGDLVVLRGNLGATALDGRLGFIVGLGQTAPVIVGLGQTAPGWPVFWVHIPGRGTFCFDPAHLQELP